MLTRDVSLTDDNLRRERDSFVTPSLLLIMLVPHHLLQASPPRPGGAGAGPQPGAQPVRGPRQGDDDDHHNYNGDDGDDEMVMMSSPHSRSSASPRRSGLT